MTILRDVWNWFFAPLFRTATNTGAGVAIGIPWGSTGMLAGGSAGMLLGAAHGWRMAFAHSYDWTTPGGVFQFILDNTWALPDSVIGSLFATLNLWNGVERATSNLSGTLYHTHGWFGSYDTTFGNVTVGIQVPLHERVHAQQARIFGPTFYPLFALSYAINICAPYWLFYHDYSACPMNSVGRYFKGGVYPHTWFEEWAYAIEGSPPC